MSDEWLSTWMPKDGSLGTDEEGLRRLLRACGCHTFEDMYDQVMNSTPDSRHEDRPVEVQREADSLGRVEVGSPASDMQLFREDPAIDESSVESSSATSDSDYNDLLNFESDGSPPPIGDIDMDELIGMYGFDEPASSDDHTTLCGDDDASEGDACVYPTPATTASTVTGLGPLDVGG